MTKFKIGDIVVGNERASASYGATREGVILKVTKVYDNGNFAGKILYSPNGRFIGMEFGNGLQLNPECFDLAPNKIVITTDGVTTTAKLYSGKTVIKTAEAKCAPGDKFDFEFGARLAMDRLVGKKEDKVLSFKNTESFTFTLTGIYPLDEKKKAKVLSAEDFDWNDFKKGECAIMVHTRSAYDEMLRRIKRRFCPSRPVDIIGYYGGSSGYLYYGKDEKLRFVTTTPDIDYIEVSKFLKKRINMTDDDWKAFDNSDMTLRVTEDVEDGVLLALKCLGYTWRNGMDMTSWTPGLDVLSTPPHHVTVAKIVKKV